MSRHYYEITTVNVEGLSDQARQELFAKLAKKDSKLAQRLAKIDWNAVTGAVAKKALQQVATQMSLELKKTYDNGNGYESGELPKNVTTLGVLAKGQVQLAVAMKADGGIQFYHNRLSSERGGPELRKWQEAFNKAYHVQAVIAMVEILGKEVTVEKADSGVIVIKAKVEGK